MESHKFKAAEVQANHHRLILNYRAQDRIIQSDFFKEAWGCADADERKFVLGLFSNPNSNKLKRWMLKILVGGLSQYPIKVLRQIASYRGIKNYSRMMKTQLLESLTMRGVINGGENIKGLHQ